MLLLENFRRQEYYWKSLELLNGYPPACKLLGEPIAVRRIELGDPEKTRADGFNAKVGSVTMIFPLVLCLIVGCSAFSHWLVDYIASQKMKSNTVKCLKLAVWQKTSVDMNVN